MVGVVKNLASKEYDEVKSIMHLWTIYTHIHYVSERHKIAYAKGDLISSAVSHKPTNQFL